MKVKVNIQARFFRKRIRREDVHNRVDKFVNSTFIPKKIYLWIMVAAFSSWFILQTIPDVFSWDTDSPSYYVAAKGILSHVSIYEEESFQDLAARTFGKSSLVTPYLYPPVLAQTLTPLAALPVSGYFTTLHVLNILLTLLCLYLISILLELRNFPSFLPGLFLAGLLVGNIPLLTTIHHGQVNVLVFALILLSLVWLKNDNLFLSSLALCLAVYFKITPILFLIPILFYKKYKYFLYTLINAGGIATLSILASGVQPWRDFANATQKELTGRGVSVFIEGFRANIDNNSLKGFLHQLFSRLNLPSGFVLPAMGCAVIVLCVFLFLALKKVSLKDNPTWCASAVFLLSLILSPLSWSHHYVVAIFPLAYMFSAVLEKKRYSYMIPLLVLSALILYTPRWGGFPFNQTRLISVVSLLFLMTLFIRQKKHEGSERSGHEKQ